MKKQYHSLAPLVPFLKLWGSQSISAMGTAMTNYALVIWVYGQTGNATGLSLMTLCSFLPTILFRFAAGAAADRWNKKGIMLVSDMCAACGTLTILGLYAFDSLTTAGLYCIQFLLSLMNAFQVPAAHVATSLLVPQEYYSRTGGLQTLSNALISILSPVLGSMLLVWGGLETVLIVDLFSFAAAFATLIYLPIPSLKQESGVDKESFAETVSYGLRYLHRHPAIWRMILLIALVNFLAKVGADGQLPAFILSRTEQNQGILGAVQSAIAAGLMAGGMLTAFVKQTGNNTRRILLMCMLIFAAGILFAVSRHAVSWCIFAFLQYLFAAVMNVYWGAKMREAVPISVQGRVYSARDTIQNCTIPLGLYLGGVLTDRVMEPAMAGSAVLRRIAAPLVGTENGAGIALLFLLVSVLGFAVCGLCAVGRQSIWQEEAAADESKKE